VQDAAGRTRQEIAVIVDILSELTGLSSRWNGEVELSQDARILGRKPFSCRIVLSMRLVNQPTRWRTLIHEALHSFSAGYNMTDYQAFLGWEEGVVEQTQRLLRPAVLTRLGLQIDDAVFAPIEISYSFNKYIQAIERMRSALKNEDELSFYLRLLATEIKRRHNFVFGIGNRLPAQERAAFVVIFSAANSVLKEALQ
jgi:hypothetical protein